MPFCFLGLRPLVIWYFVWLDFGWFVGGKCKDFFFWTREEVRFFLQDICRYRKNRYICQRKKRMMEAKIIESPTFPEYIEGIPTDKKKVKERFELIKSEHDSSVLHF